MAFQPIRPADKALIRMDQRMELEIFGRTDRPDAVRHGRAAHRNDPFRGERHHLQAVAAGRPVLDVDVEVFGLDYEALTAALHAWHATNRWGRTGGIRAQVVLGHDGWHPGDLVSPGTARVCTPEAPGR